MTVNRNGTMCCFGNGAKIVTQKTTEVGERGGLQKTEVARNGLSVWCVNAFIIGVLIDEISAYAGME